jgi:hypothetical protein
VIGNTTAAGTGVAIPAGKTVTVWSDGTNFAFQNTYIEGTTGSLTTANWQVLQVGVYLYFKHDGVSKMRLDPDGNAVVTGDVTAFGTL